MYEKQAINGNLDTFTLSASIISNFSCIHFALYRLLINIAMNVTNFVRFVQTIDFISITLI